MRIKLAAVVVIWIMISFQQSVNSTSEPVCLYKCEGVIGQKGSPGRRGPVGMPGPRGTCSQGECENSQMKVKWNKSAAGKIQGTQGYLGYILEASAGSELRITGTVRRGARPWHFKWFHKDALLMLGEDYSFEYSNTSSDSILIIHSLKTQDAGLYTAVVRNCKGLDRHYFYINVKTIVSCNNDPLNTDATCTNCRPNQLTQEASLTLYAHSFGPNIQLTWYRVARLSGQREVVSTYNIVNGANQLNVPIQYLCNYTYEVVVTGQNTYTFQCSCDSCLEADGTRLECCSTNQTLLEYEFVHYADILLLIDVSNNMDTEHAALGAFLPRFEAVLLNNAIGNNTVNQNHYTAVAFGSQRSEGKEYPYFVGPNLNRGDSTQNVYFTIDINNPINVTNTIAQLPSIGDREDGYAATNFAVKYANLREKSIKLAILITDEFRSFFYRTEEEILESSTLFNDFIDQGRSIYVNLLKSNNIIPIQIIDVNLFSGSTQCLGVSSEETCFYRAPGMKEIGKLENTEVINSGSDNFLRAIHRDYLQTALKAGGFVWDLKLFRQPRPGHWDAITDVLISDVLTRTAEKHTLCRSCRCFPGGKQCTIVPDEDQAACKCENNFPGNTAYCLCIMQPDVNVAYCKCRFIEGFSEAACQGIGIDDFTN